METVPIDVAPPMTEVGDSTNEVRVGIETVMGSVKLTPFRVAVMLDLPANVSVALAATLNVAEEAPSATITVPGTVATVVNEDFSETAVPPIGAAPLSVTVPTEVPPTETAAGRTVNPVRVTVGVWVGRLILHAPIPYVPATRYRVPGVITRSSTMTLGRPAVDPAFVQVCPEFDV